LADARLEFAPDYNFIVGENGAGKTNLLEAIFYCCLGSSFRTGDEQCLLGFGRNYLRVEAKTAEKSAGVYWGEDGKSLTLQGNTVRRLSDFIGWLGVTFLSIEDIWLIRGAPIKRRSFLNWTISKFMPSHLFNIMEYKKVIRQRNRILQEADNFSDLNLLEAYDEQLVNYGNKIYNTLRDNLPEFKESIKELGVELGLKNLAINYHCTCPNMKLDQEMFKKIRKKEVASGSTLLGPHRDDLHFFLNGRPLKFYASEGEERTAVIALKLAEAEILNKKTGKRPLLLLDEVGAELDLYHRQSLFDLLKGQIFYASVNVRQFKLSAQTRQFIVKGGGIEVS